MATEQQQNQAGGTAERPEGTLYAPPTDIYETNEAVHVLADMPGVGAEGVEITLENNVLTIRGRVKDVRPSGCSLSYSEYEAADFERAFTLSDEIDRERIEAKMENGVLRLTLPKAQPTKRKIEVQTG